ncbi:hypothetical protein K431DRAFT_301021 [Polychaeton citri CBS 116435]|uniref:Uncharacterized protein n=1 Tax=Polychaeton citri CBS 116435 TaxID=1314669 RepID=A0A9P4QDM8_9PEZI|nr:hypothetical protein K431DRAFT_301021 [Polychaeton citri CBS 116435]
MAFSRSSMSKTLAQLALCVACCFEQVAAQAGPNTIAEYNPNKMTMSFNGTFIAIPVNSTLVASAVSYPLIPLPTTPTPDFPNGWPAGTHPVLVSGGYGGSIKVNGLFIPDFLLSGRLQVPCVDRLGDGSTCFLENFGEYIGGDNGQLASGLVPAIVGSLQGTTLYTGQFTPGDANLQSLGGGDYSLEVDQLVLENPASGPGVAPLAFQFIIEKSASTAAPTLVSESGFHSFINQPGIGNNGLCIRSPQYFNETFARPFFADATYVDLSQGSLFGGVPNTLAGHYTGVAYSANSQQIVNNAESCQSAADNTDPASLQ